MVAAAMGIAAASAAAGDAVLASHVGGSVTSAFKAAAASDAGAAACEVSVATEASPEAGLAAGPDGVDAPLAEAAAVMCSCVSSVWAGAAEQLGIGAGAVAAEAECVTAAEEEAGGSFCDASSADGTLVSQC